MADRSDPAASHRIPTGASVEIPAQWSASPLKRALYGTDTYAIEGLAQFGAALDDPHRFANLHTYLLVKPEAVASRRLTLISSWWTRNDFRVAATRTVRFNRWMVRALWGYHWNAVTEEHRRAVDRIMTTGPSALILLRDVSSGGPSASARLARSKGPADPRRRSAGELRHALGGEGGPLLNFVHSPDEPLDFVRELSVLLDEESLISLLAAAGDRDDAVELSDRRLWGEVYADAGAPPIWAELAAGVENLESQAEGVERLLAGLDRTRCAAR
jgi:nucleoside diphosphate kinase